MLSREQLLHLFDRFSTLTSHPDVKKRIADAVNDNQEAVAVTTAIQEQILKEMGVDPAYGLACLGKINMEYENDQDLMLHFYNFVAKEEMACEEAELGPQEYSHRLQMQHNLHSSHAYQIYFCCCLATVQPGGQISALGSIKPQITITCDSIRLHHHHPMCIKSHMIAHTANHHHHPDHPMYIKSHVIRHRRPPPPPTSAGHHLHHRQPLATVRCFQSHVIAPARCGGGGVFNHM